MPRATAPFGHPASARSRWASTNVDIAAPWRLYRLDPITAAAPAPFYFPALNNSFGSKYHLAGQWIQDDAELGGDLDKQWILGSTYNMGPSITPPVQGAPGQEDDRTLLQAAVGFLQLDGGDSRILCHTYQLYDPTDYWELPRATISPDGKIVLFDSDMLNSGRADLFVVEVPLR